jgi:hypothetical protein
VGSKRAAVGLGNKEYWKMTIDTTGALEAQDDRAGRLRDHAIAIRDLRKRTAEHIIEIGLHLVECKKILGHGNFVAWIEEEFGWGIKTAQRFINIHEFAESKNDKLSLLNLPLSSLYLLAAPSTPEKVRDEVMARAEAGEQISVAGVKQAIAEAKPPAADPDPEMADILAVRAGHTIVNGTNAVAGTAAPAPSSETEPTTIKAVEPTKKESEASKLMNLWASTTLPGRQEFFRRIGEPNLRKALPDEVRRALEEHFHGNQKRQQRAKKKAARTEKKVKAVEERS